MAEAADGDRARTVVEEGQAGEVEGWWEEHQGWEDPCKSKAKVKKSRKKSKAKKSKAEKTPASTKSAKAKSTTRGSKSKTSKAKPAKKKAEAVVRNISQEL